MYINPAFKTDDRDALAFVRERSFGAVVAVDGAQPVAAHVPLLLIEQDGAVRLEAHVAKANPLHQVIAAAPRVLVTVTGADAYISPDWYVSENLVPTWNYSAVHLSGTAHVLPPERTHAHVEAISLDREERLRPKRPWSTAKMSDRHLQMMLAAIVAIEIRVDRIETVFKLSQNRSAIDAHEVARMLDWRGSPSEKSVARDMRGVLRFGKPA
ncbi:MAG: FMN-binding negative transcriptional regulator [Hyphomicrobiaceae bacterium]